MRAVVCREIGSVDDLVVEERPTPEPAPGDVLIAVRTDGAVLSELLGHRAVGTIVLVA